MAKEKATQSELDGVQYRRAKLWQIILFACSAMSNMAVYILIQQASYAASIGFGVSTAIIGVILMGTRFFDAFTDSFLAFVYDRVNTRFGKIRVLLLAGYAIESIGILAMFDVLSSKGHGVVIFAMLYMVYIIGYTLVNMTGQTIPALMSNDPKQRPQIGVWVTAMNYIVPMAMSIILSAVLLPRFGGEYNQAYLSAASRIVVAISGLGVLLTCIGVSAYDKPEYYRGIGKHAKLRLKDMIDVLAHNKPLQSYIVAQASDKMAQVTASQSIITTMLYGIIIGNMGLATILSAVGMLPSILFAIVGARYAGRNGSKKGIVNWTVACIGATVMMFLFFVLQRDPSQIAVMGSIPMVLYVLFTFAMNGTKMCVTTCATSFMADVIDYELDRSGKYIPAVVTGTYSLIDKVISSLGAVMATGCITLIGYTTTVPQPTDALTPGIFWMTMVLMYGLPIIGWLVTLIAMRSCKLDKAEMVEVQKRIADKKAAAQAEAAAQAASVGVEPGEDDESAETEPSEDDKTEA